MGEAVGAGVEAAYREISSSKGHDAFLIEWEQLTGFLSGALADGIRRCLARSERTGPGVMSAGTA